jgi:hypothetical protein
MCLKNILSVLRVDLHDGEITQEINGGRPLHKSVKSMIAKLIYDGFFIHH